MSVKRSIEESDREGLNAIENKNEKRFHTDEEPQANVCETKQLEGEDNKGEEDDDEDDDEEEEDEVIFQKGGKNEAGNYEGFNEVKWKSGLSYVGDFKDGEKCGKGKLSFPDGSYIEGLFADDEVNGEAKYCFPDESYLLGLFRDGELNGKVTEYSCNGIAFEGTYENNVRNGFGILHYEDGGRLEGMIVEGDFDGDDIAYVFPCGKYALKGTWEEGLMVEAKYVLYNEEQDNHQEIDPMVEEYKDVIFTFDESTEISISENPLLEDPWEKGRVCVKPSEIENAKEGLFSKIDMKENEVVSFYNGIKLTHKEVDERDWSLNDNTMSLNEEVVIDVPPSLSSILTYNATLGHKANHKNIPNCKYDTYTHPRFGDIKCVRSIKKISKGDELTCCYDYQHDTLPEWYEKEKEKAKA